MRNWIIPPLLILGAFGVAQPGAAQAAADATDAIRTNAGAPARLVTTAIRHAERCAIDDSWSCVRAEGAYIIERAERMRARLDQSGRPDDGARAAVARQRAALARLIRGGEALEAGEVTRSVLRELRLGVRGVRTAVDLLAWIPSEG